MEKYKNNKFKTSAPTQNEEFELPNGSYSVSDIQDYFEYILKKEEKAVNPSIRTYINKIKNRITFRYHLELLTPQTMTLLRSAKIMITKNRNGEHLSNLKFTEKVLVCCSIVNNDYQQNCRLLNSFLFNKSLGELLDISHKNYVFLKTFNSEFSYIEVGQTEKNSKLLDKEDRVNITLVAT